MVVRSILMILANLLLASQALAQQPEPDQKALFAAYLNSPVYRVYLEQIFNAGEPAILKAECPVMKVVVQNRASINQSSCERRLGISNLIPEAG